MSGPFIKQLNCGFCNEDSSAISEHVKNIRAKFQKFGENPIATVWGIGYKWD